MENESKAKVIIDPEIFDRIANAQALSGQTSNDNLGLANNAPATTPTELDTVEKQQVMIAIREFQKTINPIVEVIKAQVYACSNAESSYKSALNDLEKAIQGHGDAARALVSKYVDLENAHSFDMMSQTVVKTLVELGYYHGDKPCQFDVDTHEMATKHLSEKDKVINTKKVDIKITEKIIPKFTTLEYN